MKFIKNNPRRSLIIGCYVLAFIIFNFLIGVDSLLMVGIYLGISFIFILIYYVECIAVLGNYFFQKGEYQKAVKHLTYAITRKCKNANAYLTYAMILLRQSRAAEAEPLLENAYSLCTNPLMIKNIELTRASCQWLMGDVDKAIKLLEQMQHKYEYVNDRVLSTLGYMYLLKNDFEQAEALSRKALDDNPCSHPAWDNLGQIAYKKNNLPQAREAFEKALEYKNDLPDSLYYLGLIARQAGDEEQAQLFFKRALGSTITGFNTVTEKDINEALLN